MRGRFTSGPVRANDEVMFQSSTGRYLSVDATTKRLVTVPSGVFWRLLGHQANHF